MSFECVVETLEAPCVVVHGGAGAYLKTTTARRRRARGVELAEVAGLGLFAAQSGGGARAAVLAAVEAMELSESFNAGRGSKLQRDGRVRVSAALMDGLNTRMSAVFNVEGCLHPCRLADALQGRGDRNLDGLGAAQLMEAMGVEAEELQTERTLARWRSLLGAGDTADPEGAIGDADRSELSSARAANLPVPGDLDALQADDENRYGTVGALALDVDGELWACTSTGGRGHESPGRISDTGMPAGNYACPVVAVSATGFGEQIIDLNIGGRIATRVIDGASLREALERTFEEVASHGGLLGVIALTCDGEVGYAHTTEAIGVAWVDASGGSHVDRHGR